MPEIPIVENPKRRRAPRNRKGRFMKRRKPARRKTTTRRRKNPRLARRTNPRRVTRKRTYRRRRNPQRRGLMGFVDVSGAMSVAAGAVGVRLLPGMVSKFIPQVPTAGPMGLAVKAGSAILLGYAANMLTTRTNAQQVANGALAMVLVDVYDSYIAPAVGLQGFTRRAWSPGGANRLSGYVKRGWSAGNSSRLGQSSFSPAMLSRTSMPEYAL